MQRRLDRFRRVLYLTSGVVLAWCGSPGAAIAQETAPLSAPAQSSSTSNEELPLLVVVLQRPATAQVQRDDANLQLLTALGGMLRNSGRYRVVIYSPTNPTVRRALLDHELMASELIEPIKPDALQRLGHTLGARFVLSFLADTGKEGMTTNTTLQQAFSPREWHVLFTEQVHVAATYGKSHLKRTDMVNLTVDDIASRMDLPSRLAGNLRLKGMPKEQVAQQPTDKGTTNETSGTGTNGATAATGSSGSDQNLDTSAQGAVQASKTGKAPSDKSQTPDGSQTRATDKGGNDTTLPEPQPPVVTPPDKNSQTGAKTDKSTDQTPPSNPAPPLPPASGPPQNLPELNGGEVGEHSDLTTPQAATTTNSVAIDYEALAARFRQQGDTANVITSLRHAINERPRDLGLRYQLIQAYQERQLVAAALTETDRALKVAPNDASLHRLYGDGLLAKGDAAGALKAYQEAARLDPTDILAQVALGDALLADNQYTEAMQAYQAAAKNDPKSPLPHRHLARALVRSAASDPTLYSTSLTEVQAARALVPTTDTETYREDYNVLMHLMGSRLGDLLDELQGTYQAALTGKSEEELTRAAADMRRRAEAAADYLDKLPPAAGQDVTHAHFQQAASFLLQALSLFRDYVAKHDSNAETGMKAAIPDARRELSIATKRLDAGHAPRDTGKQDASGDLSMP